MRPSVLICLVVRIEKCSSATVVIKRCRVAEMSGRAGEGSLVSRSHKRPALVKRVEATLEFQDAAEEAKLARPDPDDPGISKRRWEKLMSAWRRQLRSSALGVEGTESSPLYLHCNASRILIYALQGDV